MSEKEWDYIDRGDWDMPEDQVDEWRRRAQQSKKLRQSMIVTEKRK